MAHFAKIIDGIVDNVVVVHNNVATDEAAGIAFLEELYGVQQGVTWKQTSINTRRGIHSEGGIPLRKNYAGIGYTYDSDRDAFYAPKPFGSWTLNNSICDWEAPVPYPDDGKQYVWVEAVWGANNSQGWVKVS